MLDATNGGITHYAPNRWDHGAGWIVTQVEYAKPELVVIGPPLKPVVPQPTT
ncbi:hypothetical protein ACWCQS_40600 [Streptomyces sp. NPDC002076]